MMMRTEINPKIAAGVIVVVLLIIVAVYYFRFHKPKGELTAEQAGLGRPVLPGEIPPGVPPPPWATKSAQPAQQPGQAQPSSQSTK